MNTHYHFEAMDKDGNRYTFCKVCNMLDVCDKNLENFMVFRQYQGNKKSVVVGAIEKDYIVGVELIEDNDNKGD